MAKKLWSVLQEDLGICYVSKSTNVAIHHIFPGKGRRKLCDKYGFIVALRPDYHNMADYSVHSLPNYGLDLVLKQEAQRYFEAHYGSRSDFIREFGKSYL